MAILHHYNTDHDITSASQVVPYILDILQTKPENVIDVGCGLAQWLKIFKDYGVNKVLGIDGSHVPLDKLNIDKSEFRVCDLRNLSSLEIGEKFDLLLCLEVAEHLEEAYACQFIQSLISLSDTIIFSAAIPNQTGENHFNEKYPDYWKDIFSKYGYSFLDPFRERFWKNEKVNWWYRQNMFLVVRSELAQNYNFPYNGNFYIHPRLFELHTSLERRPNYFKVIANFKNLIERINKKLHD
jgi:SAM-dependent methyltransferase